MAHLSFRIGRCMVGILIAMSSMSSRAAQEITEAASLPPKRSRLASMVDSKATWIASGVAGALCVSGAGIMFLLWKRERDRVCEEVAQRFGEIINEVKSKLPKWEKELQLPDKKLHVIPYEISSNIPDLPTVSLKENLRKEYAAYNASYINLTQDNYYLRITVFYAPNEGVVKSKLSDYLAQHTTASQFAREEGDVVEEENKNG